MNNPASYEPLEPRQGEPRQPNKDHQGLFRAFGPYWGLLGCLGSPCLGSNGLSDSQPAAASIPSDCCVSQLLRWVRTTVSDQVGQTTLLNYSVLQPPKNNKFKLVHKDQARKRKKLNILPLAFKDKAGILSGMLSGLLAYLESAPAPVPCDQRRQP